MACYGDSFTLLFTSTHLNLPQSELVLAITPSWLFISIAVIA
jgi:hypothetical protein